MKKEEKLIILNFILIILLAVAVIIWNMVMTDPSFEIAESKTENGQKIQLIVSDDFILNKILLQRAELPKLPEALQQENVLNWVEVGDLSEPIMTGENESYWLKHDYWGNSYYYGSMFSLNSVGVSPSVMFIHCDTSGNSPFSSLLGYKDDNWYYKFRKLKLIEKNEEVESYTLFAATFLEDSINKFSNDISSHTILKEMRSLAEKSIIDCGKNSLNKKSQYVVINTLTSEDKHLLLCYYKND